MTTLSRIAPVLRGACLVLCTLAPVAAVHSQVSTRVSSVSPAEAPAGTPVTLTVSLARSEGLQRAVMVYRPFGESEYRRAEMDLQGTAARVVIPGQAVQTPSLEYYIVFVTAGGALETYPLGEAADPFTTPPQRTARLTVGPGAGAGVLFLSPESELPVRPEDVLISFSLLRADTLVDRAATRVYLDGVEITRSVVISGEVGVIVPENAGIALRPGAHTVRVQLLDRSGRLSGSAALSFTVGGPGGTAAAPRAAVTYNASVGFEARREDLAGQKAWYNRGTVTLGLRTGDWRLLGNAFLSSDEKQGRQPQNRYFLGVESPWGRAGYGDLNPTFPELILSGKRVRGVHAALTLGVFNLAVSSGQTNRAIEGALLKSIPYDSLAAEQSMDPGASYAQITPGTWGKFHFGTFERNILAVRPSFGSGETFQLGLTWMRSQDETGSIRTGSKPQENVVVGMDLVTRLDERRIELSAQGAFSAYNSDISAGTISDARIAELFPRDSVVVREVRDILSRFITVNENLRPLSLRRLSTAAGEVALQLRYFDNVLRCSYLYRGSDYTSFGQSFLRKDVQGFNISDRVRLAGNAILLTAGYERLQDNTSRTKPATTTYATVNLAMTYMPRGGFPSTTVGFSRYDNTNRLNPRGADSLNAVSDITNRLFLQSSYDFSFGAQHTASVSASSSERVDVTARRMNVSTYTMGLSLATRYGFPLTTSLDISMNYNSLPDPYRRGATSRLDYTSLGLLARYDLVPSTLALQAMASPSFGDFRRSTASMQTEWTLLDSMRLIAEYTVFKNYGVPTENLIHENFFSVRYRCDL